MRRSENARLVDVGIVACRPDECELPGPTIFICGLCDLKVFDAGRLPECWRVVWSILLALVPACMTLSWDDVGFRSDLVAGAFPSGIRPPSSTNLRSCGKLERRKPLDGGL